MQSPPDNDGAPPPFLQEDSEGANAARQRLVQKKGFTRLLSTKLNFSSSASSLTRKRSRDLVETPDNQDVQTAADIDGLISLDSTALIGDDATKDHYQWAVLYENQRGITAFSIPYYSSLSLLPTDPAPFTLPDLNLEPSHHPPVTPKTYPLPDGTWHWVSRAWMIDMRSDTGQVQHDGFEYNWVFRQHNWRAKVGPMNIAGWVRRRRWIRLMVRPASHCQHQDSSPLSSSASQARSHSPLSGPSMPLPPFRAHRQSQTSSLPPSLLTNRTDLSAHSSIYAYRHPDQVWTGLNVDEDWDRCRHLMKRFGRDGRKLELWRLWLGFHHPDSEGAAAEESEKVKGKRREKQWTEDDEPMPSEVTAAAKLLPSKETVTLVPRENVIPVLQKYGADILHLFIFPDSRAQFLQLLGHAGLLCQLNLGLDSGMTEIDFWSYASGLADIPGSEEFLKSPLIKDVFGRKERFKDGEDSGPEL